MEITLVLEILILIVISGGGLYFRSYLAKKAENHATKEDIRQITTKIEAIKHDYASQLESLKATLQFKLQIDHVRYQNEYNILTELSKNLVELRNSAISLRPSNDSYPIDEPEEERKKKRLDRFSKAVKEYYLLIANKEPFIPENMYQSVLQLQQKCRAEAFSYAYRKVDDDPLKYWEKAEENAKEIESAAEEVVEKIRNRVKFWED